MRKYLLLTIVLINSVSAFSQDQSNKGKDFWLAYPAHNAGTTSRMALYLTSDINTTGTVQFNGNTIPFTITANQTTVVRIGNATIPSNASCYIASNNVIEINKGIHITALKPVVAYAHILNSAVSGSTLLLPKNVLGREYVVSTYVPQGTTFNVEKCQFVIVGVENNTTVEIRPINADISGVHPAGVSFQITLNQGDVYQFQSFNELSGSKVASVSNGGGACKKIVVFGSTTRSAIGCGAAGSGDNLFQQLTPVPSWGKNYITVPFILKNHDIIRVYVSNPVTPVIVNGAVLPLGTLINSSYYEFNANTPQEITSAEGIAVYQYIITQNCDGVQSDPEMILINSTEQTLNDLTFISAERTLTPPNTNITSHYVNVIIKNTGTALSSLRIDGVVPAAIFNPIGVTNYVYAQINLTGTTTAANPDHRIVSDSGFIAIAYGYGNVESYGYNAGTNVKDLLTQTQIETEFGIETTPSVCSGSPFRFKISLPYQPDSIFWNLSKLPVPTPANVTIYPPPDSTTLVGIIPIYWYSLPLIYNVNTIGVYDIDILTYINAPSICGATQEITFPLQVSDPPIADFAWIAPGCPAEPVFFIDNTTTVKPTYKWWWDFGDGNFSTSKSPSHIYTSPGTYTVRYSNVTTPGCLSDTISHQIIVPPLATATISGDNTVCINSASPDITFTATGGKNPYQFTYSINNAPDVTISTAVGNSTVTLPVPTATAGTFNYYLRSVKNIGSTVCTQPQLDTVVVTILPDATVTLTSAVGTNSQTICINNALANITYAVGGSGNGGSVAGLPAGVTGTYAAGVITITGTPTVSGTFNYTVSTTGPCVKPTAAGTITVTQDATIALTSAAGTDNQTLCINTPLAAITYGVGGSGTGGSVTGLPAGVTGTYAGGIITITGSATVSGTFNYIVNTTGPCVKPAIGGTITITADATIALTSAAGTNNQTVCINNAVLNITYAVGGTGNGGSVTGLPPGVTGTYAGGIITITGTPTLSGTFNYLVSTTGPCVKPTTPGTITVTADATIVLTSAPATTNQAVCLNAAIANITYAVGGTGTGGNVTGLPAGISGTYAGGIITITGSPSASGTFNYTVNTSGPCVKPTAIGTIIVHPLPTPNFSFTLPSCDTRVITFTDNSVANVGTLTNWVWNFGDGNTAAGTPVTHIYPAAGNYNATITVTTSNGCSNALPFTKVVTINNRPQAGFIVPEVCINDVAAVFTDTSKIATGGFNPLGYEWNYGDPGSGVLNNSTGINGSHLYTAVGSYTVRHIVTSSLGCKDTIVNNIFINGADPVANFSVTNAGTLCANDSVSIVNISTISAGSITKVDIYWDFVGAPTVVQTDDFPAPNKVYRHKYPNFQTPPTKPYSIRFRAYSGTLCQDVKSTTITVNAAPKVQFNAMAAACLDAAPFLITQASEIGGVPGTFVYSGTGITSAAGMFNPALAGVGTHTIKYTFTSTAAGCVDTISRAITVLDTATAKFSFANPVCEGTAATFTEQSIAPAGVVLNNTIWNFGDGTPLESHVPGNTFTHAFPGWGNYTVTMYNTSAYGCKSTSKVQQVYISPIPQTLFSFAQSSVCLPNASVSFVNNSSIADNSAITYLWNFGDPASGLLNSSLSVTPAPHIYTGTGPYTVKLTVTSGSNCVKVLTKLIDFIHPQPKAAFSFSKPEVCIGDIVVLRDLTNGLDGSVIKWNWNFGDASSLGTLPIEPHLFTAPKTYDVSLFTVNSRGCNSDTLMQQFTVHPYPVVDAGPDRVVLQGGSITILSNVTGNDLQYLWTPATYLNNSKIASPTANNLQDDITYTLMVTGRGGCAKPDSMFVKVLKAPRIPNTFTPNGDGINEFWLIDYLDTYPNCRVQVFTRTGQLVFESKGYKTPWNGTLKGKPLPFDTYYYIVEPESGRAPITGYVTIIK